MYRGTTQISKLFSQNGKIRMGIIGIALKTKTEKKANELIDKPLVIINESIPSS